MTIPYVYIVPEADTISQEQIRVDCVIQGIFKNGTYEVAVLNTLFPLTSFDDLINAKATTTKIEMAAKVYYNNQFNNAVPLDLTPQQIEDLVIAEQNIIEHKN
jgi:hypothetical protein